MTPHLSIDQRRRRRQRGWRKREEVLPPNVDSSCDTQITKDTEGRFDTQRFLLAPILSAPIEGGIDISLAASMNQKNRIVMRTVRRRCGATGKSLPESSARKPAIRNLCRRSMRMMLLRTHASPRSCSTSWLPAASQK